MGTKRYNPINGEVGFPVTGVINPADGTTMTADISYVSLVAGDGTEIYPTAPGSGTSSQRVQGSTASGAADDGSGGVKIAGIVASTSLPTLAAGSRADILTARNGALLLGVASQGNAGADGVAQLNSFLSGTGTTVTQSPFPVAVGPSFYNGTGWDRARGDLSGSYTAAASFWTESTAAQTASATLNGGARSSGGTPNGVGSRFNMFVAEVYIVATGGTLYIDKSYDGGTTWFQVGSIAVTALNTCTSLKIPISAPTYRGRFVNGTNAQTTFSLTTAYTTA